MFAHRYEIGKHANEKRNKDKLTLGFIVFSSSRWSNIWNIIYMHFLSNNKLSYFKIELSYNTFIMNSLTCLAFCSLSLL